MKKIAIWKFKAELRVLRHVLSMMLFAVLAVGDYWSNILGDTVDEIVDLLTDVIDIRMSTAETVVAVFAMYVIVLFSEHFVKFGVASISKLFKKQPTQETEVSE